MFTPYSQSLSGVTANRIVNGNPRIACRRNSIPVIRHSWMTG
jgi:hypothetical protein